MNFRIDVDALMNRGYMSRILGGIALSIAMVLCLVFACGGSGDDGGDGSDGDGPDEVIALEPSLGVLNPEFDAKTLSYTVNVGLAVGSITFAPGTTSGGTVLVNDIEVESDVESPPILLRVGSNLATVVIHVGTVEETTYTIDVVRGAGLSAFLNASNPGGRDRFGRSIAIDGDTLVVGAPFERSDATGINETGAQDNDNALGSGAVYVFTRDSDSWAQQAYIKASNTDAGDNFGWSIAIDGDTLIVGATGEDSDATDINGAQDNDNGNAVNSGAVYVFTRDSDSWAQQAYIKASNTGGRENLSELGDQFGHSVAIDGDTLIVGANGEDSIATDINGAQDNDDAVDAGAVYVFTRDSDSWTQQAYIKASNTGNGDNFGWSVAIDGDTLVVSAPFESSNATDINGVEDNDDAVDAGAVYVFTRDSDSWTQQAYIKASNTDTRDSFGWSVAIDGDTLIVGAIGESSNATGINGAQDDDDGGANGAVYVFTRDGDNWLQQAYIKASNTDSGNQFGHSVAIDGDTLIVGANRESSNATGINGERDNNKPGSSNSGAAYMFTRDVDGWAQQAYIKASNTSGNALFGGSVAIDGDVVVVGANENSTSGTGTVYVY